MSTRRQILRRIVTLLVIAIAIGLLLIVGSYVIRIPAAVRASFRHSTDHTWRVMAYSLVGSEPGLSDHEWSVRCRVIDELHPALFEEHFDPSQPGDPTTTIGYRDALLAKLREQALQRGEHSLASAYEALQSRTTTDPDSLWFVDWSSAIAPEGQPATGTPP